MARISSKGKRRMMIAQKDPSMCSQMKDHLKSLGYEVTGTAESIKGLMGQIQNAHPDLVLISANPDSENCDTFFFDPLLTQVQVPVVVMANMDFQGKQNQPPPPPISALLVPPFDMADIQTAIELTFCKERKSDALPGDKPMLQHLESQKRALSTLVAQFCKTKERQETLSKQVETLKMDLLGKNEKLSELKTTIDVLLRQKEERGVSSQENLVANTKGLIGPILKKLKATGLSPNQSALVTLIEESMNELVSPYINKLSKNYYSLSSMELTVAKLIQEGLPSKKIAQKLGVSVSTINTHRDSIRKKIGIKNKKINLKTFLSAYR